MNRLPILLCPLLFLGGCAAGPEALLTCPNSGVTPVNIRHQSQDRMVKIQIAPKLAEVDAGDKVRIRIREADPPATVTITGKDAQSSWLNSSSTGGDIEVCVPSGAPSGTVYRYKVEVSGIGMIDPEVRVR